MTKSRFTGLTAICFYAILQGTVATAHPQYLSINAIQLLPDASRSLQSAALVRLPSEFGRTPFDYIHHRRHLLYRRTYGRVLMSRGGSFGVGGPTTVVGRLGAVITDSAQIVAGRDRYGRLLSVVPKGQNLAVIGQTDDQYAVLMLDHSTGFIAKSSVKLLDLQVVNTGGSMPDTSSSDPDSQSSASSDTGSLGMRLVRTATDYLGVPYLFGGETRDGIDCSAFVKAVYSTNGINLPRVSRDQVNVGYTVPLNDVAEWVPGDRLYFACHHPDIDHTGMYIGNGYFIHASAGHGHEVAIDRIDNDYYRNHLVAVRRSQELLGDVPTAPDLQATALSTPDPNRPTITTIKGSSVAQTPIATPTPSPTQSSSASSSGSQSSISITADPESSQE